MAKSVPTVTELLSLAPNGGLGFTPNLAAAWLRHRSQMLRRGVDPARVATTLIEAARVILRIPVLGVVSIVACDCGYSGGLLGPVLEVILTTNDYRTLTYDVRKDSWRVSGDDRLPTPPPGCTATMSWECR